jgi:serine/threonine-protein kinase
MQPTVIVDSPAPVPPKISSDGSGANVGFVAGDRARFSDETAALLHRRLSAAALVLAVVLAASFVGNFVRGTSTLWWLRGLVLLIIFGSVVVLRARPSLSLWLLRTLELVVFGAVVLQMSLMVVLRLDEYASRGDAPSVAALQQLALTTWCVLIFIYSVFMPNTWRRAAAIMVPVAILPYLVIALQRWHSPEVASLLDADLARSPLPFPLIAALVGVFASHVINSARREAFKARRFGQYRLMDRLGAGGMGEVYKAEHMLLKRPCAIKLIKAESEADAKAVARFEKEVKTTAKLTHWNTIEIYDYGRTDDGTFYYVMELLPGMSLEDLVKKYGPLPPERVVHLLRQVCGALQEAHSVGLIHRDIKPANIFASQRGGVFDVVKLFDFGLVKEGAGTSPDPAAKDGSFSGTPLYMSPEQASAYEDVDGRADIYSLGAVAYHLLTGRPPFTSKSVLGLLVAHRNAEVVLPSRLNPAVPADLDRIILRCLAKDPSERFQDADELRTALEQCSCANGWGPREAATWWRSLDGATNPEQNEQPRPAIDAAADYPS